MRQVSEREDFSKVMFWYTIVYNNKIHMKFKSITISLALIVISIFSSSLYAQTSPNSISVDIIPSNPAPNENVNIYLSSYGNNLDSVNITWFVGGKKTSSGIGVKAFAIQAPSAGAETAVKAVISLPDGEIQKNIIIRPNILVLLWQANDSYVPPFYKGKALPAVDSEIKVVAIPEIKRNGVTVNSRDMVYYWRLNYTNDGASSGYGKNTFTYTNDYLESSENVAVSVATTDGQYSSEANINITPSVPQISFYRNDDNLGIVWDRALKDGHKIVGDEIIVAEPYFMSPKELWDPSIIWNWYLNNNLTNNTLPYNQNWMPVRVQGDASGFSTLRLEIGNQDQLFGTADREINLQF